MRRLFVPAALLAFSLVPAAAHMVDPSLFAELRWRLVGPFRGGWGTMAEGIPDEPDTLLFRRGWRRHLEDRRRVPDTDAHFRPGVDGVDRRARDRPFDPNVI